MVWKQIFGKRTRAVTLTRFNPDSGYDVGVVYTLRATYQQEKEKPSEEKVRNQRVRRF